MHNDNEPLYSPGNAGKLGAPWVIVRDDDEAIEVFDCRREIVWLEDWSNLPADEYTEAEIVQAKAEGRARIAAIVAAINGAAERPAGFEAFKAGQPARAIFRALGLSEYLEAATSWRVLRMLIVQFNDCDKGNFVALARRYDGVCSSGERVLLHAICYVTDFAWLADELGGKRVWQNMHRASGEWRQAVVACIAAEV
jgi:hypothetical protein